MTARYHPCGYSIWLEHRWNGLDYVAVFIDNGETSPTCGQEISACPGCGEFLFSADGLRPACSDTVPSGQLTRLHLLLTLRQLRKDIERETGELTEEQTLLLVDVCTALGFNGAETYDITGPTYGLVTHPFLFTLDERGNRLLQPIAVKETPDAISGI